jgi:uncharacterized membrane protein YqjE
MLVGLSKLLNALLLVMLAAGVGFSLQYPTVAQTLTAAISNVLSLPGATWRLFNVHFKLMLVGLSKLLNALPLMMPAAGVGLSLQYPTVAQALTAAISYGLSLPGATWRLFSVHFKLMLVGLSKLLNALLLVMLVAGVCFSLQYPTVAQALTAAISYVLSLPGATWRLFSVHFKLMLVGLSKLLNALLLMMLAAGVGLSLIYIHLL